MTRIETDRLVIRNFDKADWRDLHELIVKYQASDVAQYDHKWPTSEDEIQGVVEWFAGGNKFLAVCLKTTGKVIGFVSLNPEEVEVETVYELGYVFNADYHGQGYAFEAGKAAGDHAFDELGANRLVVNTAEANEPSCRLAERLGMRQVDRGTASFWKDEAGEPIDFASVVYAIDQEEWSG
jgi:RimJ/RimL family protein N-acetyltransferase